VGAADLARVRVGFGQATSRGDGDIAYKNTFSPEFRNRLDARIAFAPLSQEIMGSIVDKAMKELGEQLAERGTSIELSDAARTALSVEGYDRDNGARPLSRLIQDKIKRALGDELLFGQLENGGHVIVDVHPGEDGSDEYVFRFEPVARLPEKSKAPSDETLH
jgi:ATP-dependent Clp protease ATP-binding subunit ClpA